MKKLVSLFLKGGLVGAAMRGEDGWKEVGEAGGELADMTRAPAEKRRNTSAEIPPSVIIFRDRGQGGFEVPVPDGMGPHLGFFQSDDFYQKGKVRYDVTGVILFLETLYYSVRVFQIREGVAFRDAGGNWPIFEFDDRPDVGDGWPVIWHGENDNGQDEWVKVENFGRDFTADFFETVRKRGGPEQVFNAAGLQDYRRAEAIATDLMRHGVFPITTDAARAYSPSGGLTICWVRTASTASAIETPNAFGGSADLI